MTENERQSEGSNGNDFATKTHETAEQLKNAAVEGAEQLRQQADSAKEHALHRIRRVGSALKSAGDGLRQEDEFVGRYAERAAEKLDQVAEYLSSTEPRALVRDAEQFARAKPALFFGGAFLLGLAAGRFLKSSGGELNEDDDASWSEEGSSWPDGEAGVNDQPLASLSTSPPKRRSPRRKSPTSRAPGSETERAR
jgi:hypothetical protein